MVASSINAAGGYTDQKGNFVKVDSTGKVTGIVPPVKKDVMWVDTRYDFTDIGWPKWWKTASENLASHMNEWWWAWSPNDNSEVNRTFSQWSAPAPQIITETKYVATPTKTYAESTTGTKTTGATDQRDEFGLDSIWRQKLKDAAKKFGKLSLYKALSTKFGAEKTKTYFTNLLWEQNASATPTETPKKTEAPKAKWTETPVIPTPETPITSAPAVTPTSNPNAASSITPKNAAAAEQSLLDTWAALNTEATTTPETPTTLPKMFTEKQITTMVGKYGNKESAIQAIDNALAAKWTPLTTRILATKQMRNMRDNYENTQKASEINPPPDTDFDSADDTVERMEWSRDRLEWEAERGRDKNMSDVIAPLAEADAQAWQVVDKALQDRVDFTERNFAEIRSQIDELWKRADELFDVQMQQWGRQRMRLLAEKWILNDAQAAQSAEFLFSDYKIKAEEIRKDLLLQQQNLIVNAQKEYWTIMDTLMAQQWLDAKAKNDMAARLASFYERNINTYTSNIININTGIDSNIANVIAKQIEVDINTELPIMQEKIKQELTELEKANLKWNKGSMYAYLMGKIQVLSPDLVSYASRYLNSLMESGEITKDDPDVLLSRAMLKANDAYNEQQIQRIKA